MDVWKAGGKDVDSAKADDLLTQGHRPAGSVVRGSGPSHRSSHPRSSSRSRSAENKQETVTFGRIGHRRLRQPF